MVSKNIVCGVQNPPDDKARAEMILASTFAGIGFGNAGDHLAHGMSYPVSGMVKEYIPEGFKSEHPIIPHGMCVVLTSPAVFRFTAKTNLELRLYAAKLMGVDISNVKKAMREKSLQLKLLNL